MLSESSRFIRCLNMMIPWCKRLVSSLRGHGRSFEASVTGVWPQSKPSVPHTASVSEESEDVDEDAPGTLDELAH